MIEIELKAEGNEELVGKVRERGELLVEKRQVDVYYDHPCRDFAETDEALRVRKEDGSTVLTYKGPKLDPGSKSRFEEKSEAGERTSDVLELLGFEPLPPVVKNREIYEIEGFTFTVDDVEGLPLYVEGEVEGEEDVLEELRDELKAVMSSMGARVFERRSYLELLHL